MLDDNALDGYSIDPVTGFLEKKEKNSFGPREKTAFLKEFKRTGNQSKSAHGLGYEFETVEWHFRNDHVFNRAFHAVLMELRHELEGDLLSRARKGGSKEAQMWLQAHFPETYKPSAAKQPKKPDSSAVLDGLYKKMIAADARDAALRGG